MSRGICELRLSEPERVLRLAIRIRRGVDSGLARLRDVGHARSNTTESWEPAGERRGVRLLAPSDVAARCGLSRRAVYDAIRRGELPAVRLCSRLRVTPEAFDAWLRENAVSPDRSSPRTHDAGSL